MVKVTIEQSGEPSGLAMIMQQYFEQNIRDFSYKSRQAGKIDGKMAFEAVEGDVGVTLSFKGERIEITDGCADDAAMFVRGGIFDLTGIATGGPGTLGKVLSGKVQVRSAWKHPLFALRVARFMRLPKEMQTGNAATIRLTGWKLAAGAGAAILLGLAAYFAMR
ncbi:hypothetical protein HZA56_17440 [Candidatus Poribacteria bacterium]|nr:hypothetical protein [Candidatus Poribacteria bacterium]